MSGFKENNKEQIKLLFDVRRSVRYHTKLRHFYNRLGKFFKVFTIIGGLGTVTTLLATAGEKWILLYGSLAGICSIIDLVIGTDEIARLHADLAVEFITLERQMILAGDNISVNQLAEFTDRRLEIETKEPPVLRVLDAICHNELATAMGYPESEKSQKLSWLQKFLAPICDFSADSLRKQKDCLPD